MSGENYRRFEEIVTANCPMAEAGKPLSPDVDLVELGMDSLQIISTMLQLEEAFEVTLPEEHMTLETFTTPGHLWAFVELALGDRSGGQLRT